MAVVGDDEMPSEVIWGDGQARSFSQTVDGIQKLISIGFPVEAGLEMLPGATLEKVRRWMTLMEEEQKRVVTVAREASMTSTEDEELDDDPDSD